MARYTGAIIIALILAVSVACCGVSSTPRPPSTDEPPAATDAPKVITTADGDEIKVPGTAYIDGRDQEADPPLTIMNVNIWNTVGRTEAVCKIAHGEQIQVLTAAYSVDEDRNYFEVKAGDCQGWVSEPFLGTESYDPVGDEM